MTEKDLRTLKQHIINYNNARDDLRKAEKTGLSKKIEDAKTKVKKLHDVMMINLSRIPYAKDVQCVRTCDLCEYCTTTIDETTKTVTSMKCRIRKRGFDNVDATQHCSYWEQMKPNICWGCKNCFYCSWSHGEPVEGWEAYPSAIVSDGVQSYHVVNCPEFEPDDPPKHGKVKEELMEEDYE